MQRDGPIDVDRLHEITRGSPVLLRRFTGLLVETLDSSSPNLEAEDPGVRRRAAHRMKGACANIGATALAERLETIERLPDTFDDTERQALAGLRDRTLAALEDLAESLEGPGI